MCPFKFALKLKDKSLEFLQLETALLDLYFEGNVLFECRVDLVGSKLCEPFFEEMDSEFDVEVLLLECVDVLVSVPALEMNAAVAAATSEQQQIVVRISYLFLVTKGECNTFPSCGIPSCSSPCNRRFGPI